jgi:alpha-1,6-mannosyltransferase
LLNPGVDSYTAASLHRILFTYLGYLPNITDHLRLDILSKFKLITLALFAVYYLLTLIQVQLRRRYSGVNLGLDIGWVSLVLMLLATPWLMPWYASILLPIAALNIDDRRFLFASLAFCLSSTAYYMLLSTGIFQSWFMVGLPFLVLGLEMILSRSKRYVI